MFPYSLHIKCDISYFFHIDFPFANNLVSRRSHEEEDWIQTEMKYFSIPIHRLSLISKLQPFQNVS